MPTAPVSASGAQTSPAVKAAVAHVVPVFAVAFALGALRVTLVAPATGALVAGALEVPVVLILSRVVAGRVLRRWPLPLPGRLRMGTFAFALPILGELLTALAFGQTPAQFLGAMATPTGALGLAGQIGFGLIPPVRQARGWARSTRRAKKLAPTGDASSLKS